MESKQSISMADLLGRYRGAVMGVAAFWVMLLHCWILIIPNRPILGSIEGVVKWNGTLGVEIFFFYSGMGLTYAIRKGTLKRYYLSRVRRLLFPFWFMAAVHAVSWEWSFGKFLKIASGFAFLTEDIFALLWFVPAVFLLYLVFPLYHWMMRKTESETAFTLSVLCVWLGASILLRDTLRGDLWCMTNRIPCFLLGVWVGEYSRKRNVKMTGIHWVLLVLCIVLGWMLRDAGNKKYITLIPQFDFVPSVLIGVPLCFLFSGMFAGMEVCGRWIGRCAILPKRLFSWIGGFSLELYCIHQWLYGYIYSALEGRVTYLMINLLSFPVLIIAGWALYKLHGLFWRGIDRLRGAAN